MDAGSGPKTAFALFISSSSGPAANSRVAQNTRTEQTDMSAIGRELFKRFMTILLAMPVIDLLASLL
jgi:hypothetical protein